MTIVQPTDTDYRFIFVMALLVLMGFIFGLVIWKGGSVQDAVAAGITPFAMLLGIIVESYFKTKE